MEMLIMIDAMKRASAARITAVMPYFGYARQDRKAKAHDPISAKLCADLITRRRRPTADHGSPCRSDSGFLQHPADHLLGSALLAPYFVDKFGTSPDDIVVVSPDFGSVTRARNFSRRLDAPIAIVDKRRQRANMCEVMNIIGDVKDKTSFSWTT